MPGSMGQPSAGTATRPTSGHRQVRRWPGFTVLRCPGRVRSVLPLRGLGLTTGGGSLSAGAAGCAWSATLTHTLSTIDRLETMLARRSSFGTAIGSHRDLHPTNLIQLASGGFALVDWDAAGPVIPEQEVACFALVFGDRGDRRGYDEAVVAAFVDGYRQAGGRLTFRGVGDLAMQASGQLWWTAQNVQLALASPMDAEQARLTTLLIENLGGLDERLSAMAMLLARCVG